MKTKATKVMTVLFVLLAISVSGLASAAEKKEFTVVSFLPESLFNSEAIKYFGDLVTKRSEGRLKFKYYWAGSLAGAKEILPMVSSGGADIGMVAVGFYPADFPLSMLGELVMVSNHMDATQKAVSQLMNENRAFEGEFARLNLMLLLTCVADISPLGSNRKIEKIEDLKGMRVRAYGTIAPLLSAWGAVPIALPSTDIYQSVQTGLLDGFTAQPLQDFRAKSLDTVTKYCIEAGIGIYHTGYFVMNKNSFKSLSAKDQEIVKQAALEANAKSNDINVETTRKAIPLVMKNGVELYSLSEDMKQNLRNLALPKVKEDWVGKVTKSGIAEADAKKILERFHVLCAEYDKSASAKNYWEIYKEEFSKNKP